MRTTLLFFHNIFLAWMVSLAVLDLVQASFSIINSNHRHRATFTHYRPSSIFFYNNDQQKIYEQKQQDTLLSLSKKSTEEILKRQWLPSINKSDDDIYASDLVREQLEQESIKYVTTLLQHKLGRFNVNVSSSEEININDDDDNLNDHNVDGVPISDLVSGKFRDLTCTLEGERTLESIFVNYPPPNAMQECSSIDIVRASVIAMQSLLIMGMQVGVKGSQQQQERLVQHLKEYSIASSHQMSLETYYNTSTSKQLKHQVDTTAGVQILSSLKRKRNAQGAYDLLVQLGVWEKHEDIALLRSGFPIRFTDEEINAALYAEKKFSEMLDPDEILGLRQDFRSMKVYTIDGENAEEIDDGLSIEVVDKEDGSQRHRVWIHIADADKYAPRDSEVFHTALTRATSVYTPSGSITMFPPNLSSGAMSLRPKCDSYALSLGVELNEDGSIDENTIQVTPSIINVDYRLTYEEVDEMLECGVGYFEEWELGALLSEANKRRKFRISNGSTEGFVPNPIPQTELRLESNIEAEDGFDIVLKIEGTHNAGYNQSSAELNTNPLGIDDFAPPVSSSSLLVTEMMIMSGEAMGKFKQVAESRQRIDEEESSVPTLENTLDLPYRVQPKPDFSTRYQELNTLESLKDLGYCHAWYARRFFEPVRVSGQIQPHYGLGLDCYVQWSSPIRRLGDLQVHTAVKRFLRKSRVNQLMRDGKDMPQDLRDSDLGCIVPKSIDDSKDPDGKITKYSIDNRKVSRLAIDYRKGIGFIKAARTVQKKSNEYWLFEYIRRCVEKSGNDVEFHTTVLALVDPNRYQYAIYVHELGLEHRYLSETGELKIGSSLLMKVESVSPRYGLLTFNLSSKYIGGSKRNNVTAA